MKKCEALDQRATTLVVSCGRQYLSLRACFGKDVGVLVYVPEGIPETVCSSPQPELAPLANASLRMASSLKVARNKC